ncbi:FAD-binding oxidoreductase [Streptomyces sp. HPF1205]|uniref:FAD-binding oxidoreductase n=1 Tax=Streptomyces sp. HPF1205 TaxID=2873262 RepID=UPI001CECFC48|nr:FAD-binding protein [Streptomyces sp. HPF1205]
MITRRSLLGAGAGALAVTGLRATTGQAATDRAAHYGGVPWRRLSARLAGRVVRPGDAAYATAKDLYDQQFDAISPQAVAYCVNPADVARCLEFAQHHRLPFAVRSGGHSLGGYSTTDGLVVDVSSLNSVSLDGGLLTVGPGAQGVDVTTALAPHGLGVVGGYHPSVGVGGFYTGGGLGLLTRSLGMGCDRITSARVVLADGSLVTASPTRHSDLYWAIRGGGGGNFGVVTSYTMQPAPVSQIAVADLAWNWQDAAAMLDGYARWLVDAPRTLNGGVFIELPDAAPGNTPVPSVFMACTTGDTALLNGEVARLLSLTGAAPVQRSPAAAVPYQALMMNFYGCGSMSPDRCHRADTAPGGELPRPSLYLLRSRLFRSVPGESLWRDVVAVLDRNRAAGQSRAVELVPFGGAVGDLGRTDTAFVHRDALFSVSYLAGIQSPAAADAAGRAAAHAYVDEGFGVLDPHSSGETYQNFIDAKLTGWAEAYYAENYPRLVRIKRRYDPHGAFRFAQGIA